MWAPALFSRYRIREHEAKKSAKCEKTTQKKAKTPSAKEKSANSHPPPPLYRTTLEARFQSLMLLGREKSKGRG
jgi:hypothetical protein